MDLDDKNGKVATRRFKFKPRRGWLSLRFKFILWVISVVMYMSLAMGFIFVHLTESNAREELYKQGTNRARVLARESAPHVLSGDVNALAYMLRFLVDDEDILYAEIRDSEGMLLSSTGPIGVEPAETWRGTGSDQRRGTSTEDVIEVTVPVTTQYIEAPWNRSTSLTKDALKRQLGTIYLRLSTTREGAAVAMISRQLAPLMLISCVVGVLGTVLVERKITKPVEEMVRATKAIASGNLGLRVSAGSRDEFGDLAQSFNHMADNLTATMVKLENYSHSLEDKVHLRTKELEAKTRALQQANAELQKLDRLKSEFISNVSHELRTPLTSIKAVAEILGREGQELPSEQAFEFLNIIESQTDRLTRLIGEILDLSHLEHDGRIQGPQAISLPDVVSEAVGALRGMASERGVIITTDVPKDIPPGSSERDKSVQVLINLIGNALKFTPEGGSIDVRARLLDQQGVWHNSPRPVSGIVVSVADTGPGITKEQLEAIFDKFKQIENAAWGKPAGSGLGLSISKEIVERFGGTIWAESEIGKGSVFHFTMKPADSSVKLAA